MSQLTADQLALLRQLVIKTISEQSLFDIIKGYLLYETLRRVNPIQFVEICQRNLAGEQFDDIITEKLLEWKRT